MIPFNQDLYDRTFDKICQTTEYRMAHDPSFTLNDLKAMLESERIRLGNDWDGRGSLYHLTASATIAAYEHLMVEWEHRLAAEQEKQTQGNTQA